MGLLVATAVVVVRVDVVGVVVMVMVGTAAIGVESTGVDNESLLVLATPTFKDANRAAVADAVSMGPTIGTVTVGAVAGGTVAGGDVDTVDSVCECSIGVVVSTLSGCFRDMSTCDRIENIVARSTSFGNHTPRIVAVVVPPVSLSLPSRFLKIKYGSEDCT